jgi:hypothetical protein
MIQCILFVLLLINTLINIYATVQRSRMIALANIRKDRVKRIKEIIRAKITT